MNSELFRLWRQSRQNILTLVASLFWIGSASAQVTDVVERFLGNQEFSGVVLVQEGRATCYEQAFNVDSIAADFEVATDSAFMIASLTKSFTAALVLDQISKRRIELDAPLVTYLPDFDADYASDVTIRQLLQNRSGIPHYTDIPGWFDPEVKDAFTKTSFLDVIASLELRFTPGTDYYYSNANYYLLGLVLEATTGERYENMLQEVILDPLGLTGTGQIYAANEPIAPTYIRTGGGYESISISNSELFRATASQYATANDLAGFMQGLATGKLLDANMLAVLFDKARPMGFTVTSAPVGDIETEVITYNGELAGTTSMLSWFPEQDLTIAILSNNNTPYSTLVGLTLELALELALETCCDRNAMEGQCLAYSRWEPDASVDGRNGVLRMTPKPLQSRRRHRDRILFG